MGCFSSKNQAVDETKYYRYATTTTYPIDGEAYIRQREVDKTWRNYDYMYNANNTSYYY